LIYFCC